MKQLKRGRVCAEVLSRVICELYQRPFPLTVRHNPAAEHLRHCLASTF